MSSSVLPGHRREDLPVAESAIPLAERRRLALLGLAIGLGLLAACALVAGLISVALFGTGGPW